MKRTLLIITLSLSLSIYFSYPLWGQRGEVVEYYPKVVESINHDIDAYTQGLFFYQGRLFESSGQYGSSFLREINLKSGSTLKRTNLASHLFAEGACELDGRIYLLTWMEREVLVFDLESLKEVGKLYNSREGWGLTTNGKQLISTDGGYHLYFHDPMTFRELSKIEVTLKGKKVSQLNELEYIEGKIWANLYGSDTIVIIDPETGVVEATLDCKNLLPKSLRSSRTDVLNGIAYNSQEKKIYLTGKYWPKLYQIELVQK